MALQGPNNDFPTNEKDNVMSEKFPGDDFDYDVVIVGGGPVGLTAAHSLGHYGLRTALIEPRLSPEEGSPRCKQLNPRTMEIFRHLGIAGVVRSGAKVPFGWSDTATFATSLNGLPLERFDGVFSLRDVRSDDLAEQALWCPQNQAETTLRAALTGRNSVTPYFGWHLESIEQDTAGVIVSVQSDAGETRTIRAKYLIAADGARSSVRKQLGIELEGSTDAIQNMQVTFHAPELAAVHTQGPAVQYWVINPEVSGLMGQLDLEGNWWAIILNAPAMPSTDWLNTALTTMMGTEVPFDVLSEDPWTARMLVAQKYRANRVFLAGDAAHLNPPWGGFGANTGIGDAFDISWKLAAVLHGWAGEPLLDSYESERRPMAQRTIREAVKNMSSLGAALIHPDMLTEGPEGASARSDVAAAVRSLKTEELYTTGFVLGARYLDSPVICYDAGAAPESSTTQYRPSGAPGARLPNHWLTNQTCVQDLLGHGMTLISLGSDAGTKAWTTAAQQLDVPLICLPLHRPDLESALDARYLLVRPDAVIAWRGHRPPENIAAILDHVRGASSSVFASC